MAGVFDPVGEPPARGLGHPGALRSGPADSAIAPGQSARFARRLLGRRHQVSRETGRGGKGAVAMRVGVATFGCLVALATTRCVDRPAASPTPTLSADARLLPARVRRLTNLELERTV